MSLFVLSLLASGPVFAQPPIRGFAPESWKNQHEIERRLRATPEAERLRTYMRRMAGKPHHAGSKASRDVAEYALGLLKEWGLDARMETFEALLPYPKSRVVEMIEPLRTQARLQEPAVPEDPDSSDEGQLSTFNAYSADGDVSGLLIYVNYGLPEDYTNLKRLGIDAKGKIVLARYGRSWRGTKAKVAHENGALACLIYSDPRDDGYFQGDVYPIGAYRPPFGVQRGSVLDMPVRVGDPQTPGWGAVQGAKRISKEESGLLMKLPVIPISYGDASELLQQLKGPVAPEPWRGALGLTYHLGPGPAKVRVKMESDWGVRPVHNVIATIPGSTYPDQWILYGNHHDAWVHGANDPVSGASALLETARSFAELCKSGWRPKRTIMFALWDAEEYGLVGSTEWVEQHRDELNRKMVAYLNTDSTGRGRISAGGSKSLEAFYREVLRDVNDPSTGQPLLAQANGKKQPAPDEQRLGSLGAGSDYVAFLHHAGIASMNLGFGGEGGGVYHSSYDTYEWYTRFSDGDFRYGRTLSGVIATMLMRLADSALVPFDLLPLASTVQAQVGEIAKSAGPSASKLDTKELLAELQKLAAAAKLFEAEYQSFARRTAALSQDRLANVNQSIYRLERTLLAPDGLPGRPWYRHQLHAPGLYTGYGVKTLPGIREAVEAERWEEANAQSKELAKALRALTAEVSRVTAGMRAR
ncbi:MAG: M28 family metallopeptidase [Bryobacterales bacterium]|nr:M28 family metallopeptidase [Bryobacterales bacterium]